MRAVTFKRCQMVLFIVAMFFGSIATIWAGGKAEKASAAGSSGSVASVSGSGAGTASGQRASVWHGLKVLPADARPSFPVVHTTAEWHSILNPEQFGILREAGTEPPYSGALLNEHRDGIFYSAATGEPLFSSSAKFESGTGWPSFYKPVSQDAVVLRWDDSYGMRRVEVLDSASGSHLGHLFDDGPPPTGLRYCMDSVALLFVPTGGTPPPIVAEYLKSHRQ